MEDRIAGSFSLAEDVEGELSEGRDILDCKDVGTLFRSSVLPFNSPFRVRELKTYLWPQRNAIDQWRHLD